MSAASVDTRYWRFCASMGPLFVLVFYLCWGILGHNFPPFSPDAPASEVATYFRENAGSVRFGMVMAMTFAPAYGVWGYSVAKVLEQVIEKDSIVVQLARVGAAWTVITLLVPTSFWLTAAFRPEALPDWMIQMLYDMAWLLIDLAYAVTSVQLFAIGAGFLADKRAVPFVPKWLAWYGIWVGFMFVLECVMPYFRNGAFARSGILNFWIEFLIWMAWVPVLTAYMFKAIGRIERGE
ncbi:hypothetical protein [Novosphingobium sp. NDB2Meth1]|uniref:hypothetical protein n=1 Tax=Novosphingobium sp. NDB2Meth1 TaxID=1892847 RepID=UPI00093141D2|nr:hypothetical protein [Novosphingobium sp. NDB2Meth1]